MEESSSLLCCAKVLCTLSSLPAKIRSFKKNLGKLWLLTTNFSFGQVAFNAAFLETFWHNDRNFFDNTVELTMAFCVICWSVIELRSGRKTADDFSVFFNLTDFKDLLRKNRTMYGVA